VELKKHWKVKGLLEGIQGKKKDVFILFKPRQTEYEGEMNNK
jgi:hypothetical protein